MALRDVLRTRVQTYLEPDETIQAVWLGQAGPSPWFALLSYWILVYNQIAGNFRIFAATDRAIVMLEAGRMRPASPKRLLARYARNVRLGPCRGLWGSIELDGRYWVHMRFHKDIDAADAALSPADLATPSGQ